MVKSHTRNKSYNMLHRKYLCISNKIIDHSNKTSRYKKKRKKRQTQNKESPVKVSIKGNRVEKKKGRDTTQL